MESIRVVDFGPPRGRGVVALRDIPIGETLFTEDPLICCQFSWNRLYGYRACDHCLCPLESAVSNARRLSANPSLILPYIDCDSIAQNLNPVYCPDCGIAYCSLDCMKSASLIYHSVICANKANSASAEAIQRLEVAWRQVHYPPESNTIGLLVRIVAACFSAYSYKSAQAKSVVDDLKTFVSSTTEQSVSITDGQLSHKILLSKFADSVQQLHAAFVEVLFQVAKQTSQTLSFVDDGLSLHVVGLDGLLDIDNFRTALCLLGRNGQGIATSAFSVWVRNAEKFVSSAIDPSEVVSLERFLDKVYSSMDNHVGSFLDNEGVGLYSYQRLLNHSCDPNAAVHFTGANSRLSVVSLRPINVNEEVTICYLDECQQMRSRHSRRRILSSNYLFWCECLKCISEKIENGFASETSAEEEDEQISASEEQPAAGSVDVFSID